MSRLNISKRNGLLASTALLLVLMLACSTDSPTAPTQEPSIPSGGANNWVITITIEPEELDPGSTDPAEIRVKVESRATPGAYPPPGASIVISTSLGELGADGSEATSSAAFLDNRGRASEFLFPTGFAGTGTVSAQLEGSVGRQNFSFVEEGEPKEPFILSVTPNSGPREGGTEVTINGTNFRPPLRVKFGDKLGTVLSATSTKIRVLTPPADIEALDCDDDGDGTTGRKEKNKPVGVAVEQDDGKVETLDNAFTYLVENHEVCVGD